MKKTLIALAALAAAGQSCFALPDKRAAEPVTVASPAGSVYVRDSLSGDSIRMVELQGIQFISTRAGEKTPMAYTDLDRAELGKLNTGVDLPFLLLQTPSLIATSEAGNGIGYTAIRIRGTDASRINVTANGIPMNDAESHSVFWVNTPDLISSVDEIQVQRGVGTSTNGAGAFGGSINMKTESLSTQAGGEVSGSYGSFNTHRESVNFHTGLLNGKWAFNARLSNIQSDGYRDRASTDLKSYFLQGGWFGNRTTVKFITFGGKEKTYHAWEGITRGEIDTIGRRYNPLGIMTRYVLDADGRPTGSQVATGEYYKDQTDNYKQFNYQLLISHRITDRWNMNVNFHYTDGYGYYEQYKSNERIERYGLAAFDLADKNGNLYTVSRSDLTRRKIMDNKFGGGVFSFDYNSARLRATIGGGANKYSGDHYGRVLWVQNFAGDYGFTPDHRYYFNKGEKTDANIYSKVNWSVTRKLNLYGDIQYRFIKYRIDGRNDNWDSDADGGNGGMQELSVNETFNFINPKVGLYYDIDRNFDVYASVAITHKEPTRNGYTDHEPGEPFPTHERLIDYELGGTYTSRVFSAGVNLYYMDYKDQFILTGKLNHIGEAMLTNIPDSYRMGIELQAAVRPLSWLTWQANATLSRNYIKKYTDFATNWTTEEVVETYLGTTKIAYSPEFMFGSLITGAFKGFNVSLQSNYVGRQYVTNSESKWEYDDEDDNDRLALAAYFVNNLRLDYTVRLRTMKSLTLGFTIYNLFNQKYYSNGYGWVDIFGLGSDAVRVNNMYYFPQAGTNFMANVTLRF
ncbi:MAG: TonB-dependent receptor [Alistipes sp.]|nr:TonB-dependent receptor [Alistipes sp.]